MYPYIMDIKLPKWKSLDKKSNKTVPNVAGYCQSYFTLNIIEKDPHLIFLADYKSIVYMPLCLAQLLNRK